MWWGGRGGRSTACGASSSPTPPSFRRASASTLRSPSWRWPPAPPSTFWRRARLTSGDRSNPQQPPQAHRVVNALVSGLGVEDEVDFLFLSRQLLDALQPFHEAP